MHWELQSHKDLIRKEKERIEKVQKVDGSIDMNVSSLIVPCSRKLFVENLSSDIVTGLVTISFNKNILRFKIKYNGLFILH